MFKQAEDRKKEKNDSLKLTGTCLMTATAISCIEKVVKRGREE